MSPIDCARHMLQEIKYYIPTVGRDDRCPDYQFIIHRWLEEYTDDDEPEVVHGIIHVNIMYEPYNAAMWNRSEEQ